MDLDEVDDLNTVQEDAQILLLITVIVSVQYDKRLQQKPVPVRTESFI